MSLLEYFYAQEKRKRAFAEYDAASSRLHIAQIEERVAEIISQHEPLASSAVSEKREAAISIAKYVVFGRKDLIIKKEQ